MKRRRKLQTQRGRRGSNSLLGPEGIEKMRVAGTLAAEILDDIAEMIGPGTSTGEIDDQVARLTHERGAVSAPLGYRGFPRHCCTSVNDVVCHGIPDGDRFLVDGDIINIDVTPIVDGFHGDTSRTFLVGDVAPVARRLVADTYRCMWLGIRAIQLGGRIGDIGHAIQNFAEAQGYSVVREFTGHGIGTIFHTEPTVFHFGTPGQGEAIIPGMAFTVEPMINLGHWKTEILDDGWTAITRDGALSAQFEHTVVITEDGVDVVTLGRDEVAPV